MNQFLLSQFRALQRNQQCFETSLVGDSIDTWRVLMKPVCFDTNSTLYKQLSQSSYDGVLLELKFTNSCQSVTHSPPWCRIISPKLSGSSIFKGSVCWEGFHSTSRSEEYNMENLLMEFAYVLIHDMRASFSGSENWSLESAREGEQYILSAHRDWKQSAFV
ncbi:hypothetical protein GEMRC1_011306 [Eukaryota sp. GEM-RC1]